MKAKRAFLNQFEVSSENRHFISIFTQISTFSLARDFLVPKGGFLSQSEVSEENCHFKFVFTQITSFSIAIDFVLQF